MEFRVLGPLEVVEDGRIPSLGGAKQRALLASLLLRANAVVSTDTLIDEVWGESPPATAAKAVQVYVSNLRKELGDGVLVTRSPGYALHVDPADFDLARFERLVAEARDAEPEVAAEKLRAALALWRGPALSDLAYEPFAQTEIARLEELRLSAWEERIEADLALGRHAELVPELESLVARHPLRERLHGQLMRALYGAGRQAEALEAYRAASRTLRDELGLEPSPALQRLERSILEQDPALEAKAVRRTRRAEPAERRRQGRWLIAVGAALIVAAAATAFGLVIRGDAEPGVLGNAVAAVDPSGRRVAAYTEVGTTPSNVVVGEGSVWVLNGDDRTISTIDPETRRIEQTFGTGRLPADLAVGEGAIWVGNALSVQGFQYLASVSRIDPGSRTETHTVELPGGDRPLDNVTSGLSRLAVAAGAVWAINPDGTVSRIDPRTGELVAQVRGAKRASAIAAGTGGIWFMRSDDESVVRIDPRSNRVEQRIEVGASFLGGIAVGGGSVWATDPDQGVVWRIEPGRPPLTRTIDVGFGVARVAFGDDAVWTANFLNGTVSRIDPRTNRVTATSAVTGTPQGLAADGRSTWVSVAGGTTPGTLQTSACGPVVSGGRRPDVLIASDLPLQPPVGEQARPLEDAVRHVLERHAFRAGDYTVGYQSCDVSTAQAGLSDFFKCGSNAKAYAQAVDLVAVIGTYHSGCAAVQIPILNRAAAGPVAMVSPANSAPGLTQRGAGNDRGEPEIYYPTGTRNFMRVTAIDSMGGAAGAVLAKQLGLRRVYLLEQRDQYGVFLASGFRRAARALGVKIVGSGSWEVEARSFAGLVEPVARSGADGVFLAGVAFPGENVVTALRARLGGRVTLIGGDAFFDALAVAGRAAVGMYVALAGQPAGELGPAGRSFVRSFRRTRPGEAIPPYALEAAQATEVVLQAIARSDGTRASVLRELRALEIEDGILGSFRFDRNGDITPSPITIYRITGKTAPGSPLEGGGVDRVIRVPSRVFPGAR